MVDFITEVQEELRKDDYNRWLKRFGPYVVGLTVAALGIVGYVEWKEAADARDARSLSLAYTDASELAAQDPTQGIRVFEDVAGLTEKGYGGLALMRAAALSVEQGERMEAVRQLDEAATRFDAPRHAHLARLKAAYILAADGRSNDAETRLQGLTERGAPYEYLARELSAYNALALGNETRARQEFTYLSTIPGVLQSVAERSQQTLSLLDAGAAAEIEDSQTDTDTETPTEPLAETEDEAPE